MKNIAKSVATIMTIVNVDVASRDVDQCFPFL
jgi:hypothetical protein